VTDLDVAAALVIGGEYVAVTENCLPEHVSRVGGKAVGLGSLLRAGQQVPASFVVTARAYREYQGGRTPELTPELRTAIAGGYATLCLHGADVPVAVRSSAAVEDSAEASWAGQFQTFLGVSGRAEVLARVQECWAAALDPHVGAYRAGQQLGDDARADDARGDDNGGVAVIVQELVDARAAGVMFTRHPETGDRSLVVIESSYGLGEAVVGGEVVPDLFEINKITREQHSSRLGSKHTEYRLADDGRGVQARPVDPARQQAWSISEPEVMALADMAVALEAKIGRGLDVEWAIGTAPSTHGQEALFALQVRPITVDPRKRQDGPQPPAAGPGEDAIGHILGRLSGHDPEAETG
jgi:phosphoenolpyruvate synthase/pyruvate phosphate dikinase